MYIDYIFFKNFIQFYPYVIQISDIHMTPSGDGCQAYCHMESGDPPVDGPWLSRRGALCEFETEAALRRSGRTRKHRLCFCEENSMPFALFPSQHLL